VTVTQSNSTLVMSGDLTATGKKLTKAGAGVAQFEKVRAAGLIVTAGVARVSPKGNAASPSGTSVTNSLDISVGATLDLTNNAAIVDYTVASPAAAMRTQIINGFNGGNWLGTGISSSTAAAVAIDSANAYKTGIGYAEASALGMTSFAGQSVDGDAFLLRYTLNGDANLDGQVNALDFNSLASSFGANDNVWYQGDFNYDGTVNTLDFNVMANNFGQVLAGNGGAGALGTAVPEPTGMALLATVILLQNRRRRVTAQVSVRSKQAVRMRPSICNFFVGFIICMTPSLLVVTEGTSLGQMVMKTETFDTDPGWDGHNNRSQTPAPVPIVQNFGYSSTSNHAGGPAGEVGGYITPAAEPAFYAKVLSQKTFDDPFSASGKLNVSTGSGHTLLGFFNANTVNEWRTPNAISLRLLGKGDFFYAHPEYASSKWRVGASSFPGTGDDFHFSTGTAVHDFSLRYEPDAAGGGMITATMDDKTAIMSVAPELRADGATFNRFGILNVMKSVDTAHRVWLDNLTVNGQVDTFNSNPNWDGVNNQNTYTTNNVRLRFDFGYSNTNKAGGTAPGEIGGQIFRGDSQAKFNGTAMAYYGDRLDHTLDLNHALKASGKIAFHRGVSDSTSLIGFFHSTDSIRSGDSDYDVPENFVGAAIEGPSSEGFFFYPTFMTDVEDGHGAGSSAPYIYPNGDSHNWTLEYDPSANNGLGRITLSLDGQLATIDLSAGDRQVGARFDRFGIITTQVDGNGQTVYLDDLTYTVGIPEPAAIALLLPGIMMLPRTRRPD
jgi:hypothetical protein